MIQEATCRIPMNGRDMSVFEARPPGPGPFQAVILYMDIFGFRDELYDLAREFAEDGYVALLHDMFYRRTRSVFEPANDKGARVDPEALAAGDDTTTGMSVEDTRALVLAVDNGLFGARVTDFFVIGYCMGGRHALAATVALPARIRAGISVHGGRLVSTDAGSPHRLIRRLRAPFWFAFATDDPTCPADHCAQIEAEAAAVGPHVSCTLFQAEHGWTFPTRWSHDEEACQHVRERANAMFRAPLG